TELGQFNVEINIPPRSLEGVVFDDLEESVRADLNAAETAARGAHVHLLMTGILPTLTPALLNREALSANPRHALLTERILARRGPADRDRERRAALDVRGLDRPRGGLHVGAAAPAGRSAVVRPALERRAGDRGRAAGDRRQLAVLLPARAVAGDADRAVRAV